MKLILTQEVNRLGVPGDVVEVRDGYGRNYLVPRGFAIPWTKGGEKQVAQIRAARASRELASLDEARAVKQRLEQGAVRLTARTGPGGRLFGRITTADVVNAVTAAGGPQLDRRRVELPSSIKTTGQHTVTVRVHPEVTSQLTIEVVPG